MRRPFQLLPVVLLVVGVLAAPPTALAQFALKWGRGGGDDGTAGSGPGEFFDPEKVAVDASYASGDVYVADVLNHRIQKFDGGGAYIEEFGSFGTGPGQFNAPRGLAIAQEAGTPDVIYVVDSLNDRVQKLAKDDGSFILQWGTTGTGPGQFRFPRGVAVGTGGNVYVSDMDNHRIQVFTPSGAYVSEWGEYGSLDGQFQYPRGLAVNASTGHVYVADSFNHRIQHFEADGTFVSKWGAAGGTGIPGSANGEFNTPRDVAAAGDFVYVADTGNDRVQIFQNEVYLGQFGTIGLADGRLYTPRGVALATGFAGFYVADSGNHRIDLFGSPLLTGASAQPTRGEEVFDSAAAARVPMEVELAPVGSDPRELKAVIRYQLFEPAEVRIVLEDEAGRVVGQRDGLAGTPGVHVVEWELGGGNLHTAAGAKLSCRVEAAGVETAHTVSLP